MLFSSKTVLALGMVAAMISKREGQLGPGMPGEVMVLDFDEN